MGEGSAGVVGVLYVDDQGAYASSLIEALAAHEGIGVEHVPNAAVALERLEAASFDCVLARRGLAVGDGTSFISRAREASPGIAVVLLTAPDDGEQAASGLRAGADDYLVARAPEQTAQAAADRLPVAATHRHPGTDYRQVFEEATVGIIIHHPETGDIVDVNPWMAELLGYDRADLLSMKVGDFSAGEEPYTQARAEEHIRRAATEGPQTFEWLNERANGKRVWVEVSLRRTVVGGHDRVLAVIRDITALKAREAALQRQTERMEEFASVVSHDLRSPLTVAKGWVDYALNEEGSTSDEEALRRLETALERMGEIIDDSLTLAREGREAEETEPVAVSDDIAAWWKVADTTDADLVVDAPFTVEADPRRLRKLFENLFANAVRHGRPEGGHVTVHVGPLTVQGPVEPTVGTLSVERPRQGFYVADDGVGIPADEREDAFEAGYSTDPDGTGLGLAIVRRMADAHGWAVRLCESEYGGARFEFLGVTMPDEAD